MIFCCAAHHPDPAVRVDARLGQRRGETGSRRRRLCGVGECAAAIRDPERDRASGGEGDFRQIDRDRKKLGLSMILGGCGATLEEIMTAMGWQQHTTRALMSAGGSLAKKHGLVVTSEKVGDKRTYFIKG